MIHLGSGLFSYRLSLPDTKMPLANRLLDYYNEQNGNNVYNTVPHNLRYITPSFRV